MKRRLASLLLLALPACARHATAPAPKETPMPVSEVRAHLGTVSIERRLSGFLAPLQNVSLSTTLTEPAQSVPVVEGDRVRQGETLVVFDVSDLEANLEAAERSTAEARANVVKQRFQSAQTIGQGVGSAGQAVASTAQAAEKLRLDRLTLARDEALEHNGFIATQTADEARTTVASDVAALASAQAAERAARTTVATNGNAANGLQGATIAASRAAAASASAQADQIRAQISRATIASPVDGVVVNRNINPGEYPNGRTLFTVQQTGVLYAVLNASPAQVDGVRRGEAASVTVRGSGGAVLHGPVDAVLGQTTPGSTNFTIKILVRDPSGRLLAGSPVDAAITLAPVRGVVVPRTVFTDGTEEQAVRIDRGVAHIVSLRVVAEDGTNAVVTGLRSGETLVASGAAAIVDGTRVAPR